MEDSDRILFIDDDAPVRTAFRRSLRGHGFEIDLANGSKEALERLAEQQYAVIATDYRMPQMNGLDLVHELQLIQPDATYMLVSGECDLDLALEAVNEHSVAYVICKPWDIEELITVLRRSIEAYWERSGQRQLQKSMVAASRGLEEQRKRLSSAMEKAEAQVANALLDSLEMRGHETHAHCCRVAAYAVVLGTEMDVGDAVIKAIRQGALLHDIGKIAIPDHILLKSGKLTDDDWSVMRTHPMVGAQILKGFESLKEARTIVAQHHERFDGSGYPKGLKGHDIAIGARILAVADAFEAIVMGRPYRKGVSMSMAVDEIKRASGTFFDPACVNAFVSIPMACWKRILEHHPDEAGDSKVTLKVA